MTEATISRIAQPRRRSASATATAFPSAPLVAAAAAPELMVLAVTLLDMTERNPRSDGDIDLDGLTASLQTTTEPYLLQPPTVEADGAGRFRILAGERRVRSVQAAGWTTLACLVHAPLAPLLAHAMRLVENLHRQELHPLDLALALKIAWLAENATALGAGAAVAAVLAVEQSQFATLTALQRVAVEAGFVPTHPRVAWEALLAQLGLGLHPERRRKLLQVLNLDPLALTLVRPLDLSEAAMRALSTLDAPDQVWLAHELETDPSLAVKIRRIARRVKQKGYPIAKALAEARGQVYTGEEAAPTSRAAADDVEGDTGVDARADDDIHDLSAGDVAAPEVQEAAPAPRIPTPQASAPPPVLDVGPEAADAVLRLLDLSEQVTRIVTTLKETSGGAAITRLPPPWGDIAQEALDALHTATSDATLSDAMTS